MWIPVPATVNVPYVELGAEVPIPTLPAVVITIWWAPDNPLVLLILSRLAESSIPI